MFVRAKRLISPSNLAAADQKLLTGVDQNLGWDWLLDPGDVVELCQKLAVLMVS
jgi:hypothetical protein